MSAFWIGQLFTLATVVLFLGYWVRRFAREHRERMAQIEANAVAHEAAFEASKRLWDEEQAKAKTEQIAHFAALLHELGEEESASAPSLASPPNRSSQPGEPSQAG